MSLSISPRARPWAGHKSIKFTSLSQLILNVLLLLLSVSLILITLCINKSQFGSSTMVQVIRRVSTGF